MERIPLFRLSRPFRAKNRARSVDTIDDALGHLDRWSDWCERELEQKPWIVPQGRRASEQMTSSRPTVRRSEIRTGRSAMRWATACIVCAGLALGLERVRHAKSPPVSKGSAMIPVHGTGH